MEIDAKNLIDKLTKVKQNLQLTVLTTLHVAGQEMAAEISSRNPKMWQPPMRTDGKGRYFNNGSMFGDGLFDALDDLKNQITLSADGGVISMGLGSESKLTSDFGYWDLFEGYGVYKRNKGSRAGKSYSHGFAPVDGFGKKGQGYMDQRIGEESDSIDPEVNTHPGVLPSFMFRDTFNAYKPIIKKRMIEAIVRAATNG